MVVQKGLYYTKDHEWVRLEGKIATIGITDHAQRMLGEVTFVELPAVGASFEKGQSISVVESSKAASDVYAPVDGKVIEVNEQLLSRPELINQSCYQDGWICKMELSKPNPTSGLMDADAYTRFLKSQ
ncbi:MAG: glycine cleavage system protein GcvH [Sedimentisphaerales bacterium]|jgi:glycine cleavage system H protein|nr:glycine cleavage system protein GcvH [Sedimentisphaerales bacterium]